MFGNVQDVKYMMQCKMQGKRYHVAKTGGDRNDATLQTTIVKCRDSVQIALEITLCDLDCLQCKMQGKHREYGKRFEEDCGAPAEGLVHFAFRSNCFTLRSGCFVHRSHFSPFVLRSFGFEEISLARVFFYVRLLHNLTVFISSFCFVYVQQF